MPVENKRIIIAGEGGQGIQALAHILASAAHTTGKQVTYLPNFGVEQRGGVSLAYIQIADLEISFPKFAKCDLLVILAKRAIPRVAEYLTPDTVIIFDNSLISDDELKVFKNTKVGMPATTIARSRAIPRVFNIVILGALVAELGEIPVKKVEAEMDKFFAAKYKEGPQLKHFNRLALSIGYETVEDLKKDSKWRAKILKK